MSKAKAVKGNKKAERKPAVRVSPIVTFKKEAKEDTLPTQAATILSIVKSNKSLTVADLQKKMEGKITSSQKMSALWGFYRLRLIKGGFIGVAKPAKPAKVAA